MTEYCSFLAKIIDQVPNNCNFEVCLQPRASLARVCRPRTISKIREHCGTFLDFSPRISWNLFPDPRRKKNLEDHLKKHLQEKKNLGDHPKSNLQEQAISKIIWSPISGRSLKNAELAFFDPQGEDVLGELLIFDLRPKNVLQERISDRSWGSSNKCSLISG